VSHKGKQEHKDHSCKLTAVPSRFRLAVTLYAERFILTLVAGQGSGYGKRRIDKDSVAKILFAAAAPPQYPIFLTPILHDWLLVLVTPAGHGNQNKPEGIQNSRHLHSVGPSLENTGRQRCGRQIQFPDNTSSDKSKEDFVLLSVFKTKRLWRGSCKPKRSETARSFV
jgi:hypothetical protein